MAVHIDVKASVTKTWHGWLANQRSLLSTLEKVNQIQHHPMFTMVLVCQVVR